MKNKYKYNKNILIGGLIYFSLFSLIGVGFSSWAIISNDKTNINIEVGKVDDSNLLIKYNLDDLIGLSYCVDGFIYDETISNSTSLIIPFSIESSEEINLKEYFKDVTSLKLKIILVEYNLGLLQYIKKSTYSYDLNSFDNIKTIDKDILNNELTIDESLLNNKKIFFKTKYDITVDNYNTYYESELKDQPNLKISFKVEINK